MELKNIFEKKLERKKFFTSIGAGFLGYMVLSKFPFSLFGKKSIAAKDNNSKIKIKINPLAVSRNKIGDNNARS
jgi:hypothetical protein